MIYGNARLAACEGLSPQTLPAISFQSGFSPFSCLTEGRGAANVTPSVQARSKHTDCALTALDTLQALALRGAAVALTDGAVMLPLLRENVAANFGAGRAARGVP